jgi:peptide deformylase
MQEGEEGCLSFPELSYETPRAMRAVAKGWNMHGEPLVVEGTEFLARALQHETDHLNGVLFIDRLPAELRKQAMKEIREAEWFLQSQANGASLEIKVSPHTTFGRNL